MTAKTELRAKARRARAAAVIASYAETIVRFADALGLKSGSTVASYWPKGDEADPRALAQALRERGHPILLPRVMGPHEPLSFRRWLEGDATEKNALRVIEPLESAPEAAPDAVFVPLLAFDAGGFRLGYGGGYYDRSLAALRARGPVLAIGIAYAGQEIASLPHDPHDEKLDMVVTEAGVRNFAQTGKS